MVWKSYAALYWFFEILKHLLLGLFQLLQSNIWVVNATLLFILSNESILVLEFDYFRAFDFGFFTIIVLIAILTGSLVLSRSSCFHDRLQPELKEFHCHSEHDGLIVKERYKQVRLMNELMDWINYCIEDSFHW